ncbi:MAG: glutathione S-transferase N-terminal domain-containing protein [Pseudomonadota bacterium]
MSGYRIHFIDGSPFARAMRATLIEFDIPHEAARIEGFPPRGIEDLTPALQVPVLETPTGPLFGTALIRSYLHAEHGRPGALSPVLTRAERHWHDAQVLTAIDALTDALALHFHLKWAGLEPVGENRLGCDMAAREMERATALLDWLEAAAEAPEAIRADGLSSADLSLAAAVLWTEAREPIPWAEGRPKLAAIAARVGARNSFLATAPTPWT